MKRPTIENAAEGWTHITDRVVIPPRFTAVFDEDLHVSLDIGVADGTPNLLSVKIERLTGPLRARGDLRLPLLTEYVPAALAAACRTLHSGTLDDLTSDGPSGSQRVVVIANLAADASIRNDAAAPRKVGRPRKTNVTISEVAQAYQRLGKIGSTARLLNMSPATVHRRINDAKKAGLLTATKGGTTQSASPTEPSESSNLEVKVTIIPAGTAPTAKQTTQRKPRSTGG